MPLVRRDWKVICELDVLFLRRDPPGSVLHAGDVDSRIKTLIDCLRMPAGVNELGSAQEPREGENPFFVLLEDDKLVTGFSVETERLLLPATGKEHESAGEVKLVLTVNVRPYEVTMFNISFVS